MVSFHNNALCYDSVVVIPVWFESEDIKLYVAWVSKLSGVGEGDGIASLQSSG